jgi:flagellar motor protein MotB
VFVLHDGQHEAAGTVILFAVASAELSNEGKEQLQRLVPAILGKRSKLEIRGHATRDPLPPGSPFQDAWQLCYARCLATRKYLEQAGVETDRMRLSQAGVFEPYTIRENLEKQNSRVEIYVLPERVEDLTGSAEERTERFQAP